MNTAFLLDDKVRAFSKMIGYHIVGVDPRRRSHDSAGGWIEGVETELPIYLYQLYNDLQI